MYNLIGFGRMESFSKRSRHMVLFTDRAMEALYHESIYIFLHTVHHNVFSNIRKVDSIPWCLPLLKWAITHNRMHKSVAPNETLSINPLEDGSFSTTNRLYSYWRSQRSVLTLLCSPPSAICHAFPSIAILLFITWEFGGENCWLSLVCIKVGHWNTSSGNVERTGSINHIAQHCNWQWCSSTDSLAIIRDNFSWTIVDSPNSRFRSVRPQLYH